jgi:hypothetical protein
VGPDTQRLCPAGARQQPGRRARALVCQQPRIHGEHGAPRPALPFLHRRRGREAWHADGDRAAAGDRVRLQAAGLLARPRLGPVAVHSVHRTHLRPRVELDDGRRT